MRRVYSDFRRTARTRVLTRIIVYLKEIKWCANHTDFKNNICSDAAEVSDGINWLVANKILIMTNKIHGKDSKYYFINPEWEKLRDGSQPKL